MKRLTSFVKWNRRVNVPNKLGIAHLVSVYPTITETFIAQYIRCQQTYQPILIVNQFQDGLGEQIPIKTPIFPLEQINKRGSWAWALDWFDRKIIRRKPYTLVLRILFLKYHVALLHAHFGYRGVQALPIKRNLNLPLVTTFYGNDMSEMLKDPSQYNRYDNLFQHGDLFLVEGPYMRARLIDIGCPAEKITVQRIAIETSAIPFQTRSWSKEDPLKLLFCGRLVEKKGLIYGLQAVSLLVNDYPKLELRVIGDGPLRKQLELEVNRLQLNNRVKFLGYQNYTSYLSEIQSAHILLTPSVTATNGDSEGGAPTVLLEAQASGLPIVATTHADIPNVVQPDKSAILVPERDAQALAQALYTVVDNPDSWATMGKCGRQWIEQYHDIHVETRRLENKYETLLKGKIKSKD